MGSKLELYKNLRQNSSVLKKTKHKHRVFVGVGGNIGDVRRRIFRLYNFLKKDSRIGIEKISSILKNPPFGYTNQDDFFNSVVVLKTDMNPKEFLAYLMRVEKRFLRKRSFKDAPRTLDLDIIFYDNIKMNTQKLTIPHPHFSKRESVMIPLKELRV
ncbi:MAG: 2-amino-4-hydroxy-6-hydroxymethyldihydropteridine diphosphokinase [Sulfurimonas sp.]|jgi:2-amino-4-hydroxy-6-hydroxymethyldihydropteridine diphosphokinase|nr:2-amino-4-hydroxy-6-hydroxymethyldihydropteridine diphosphokinase [Sulfurimonadaceae bacterium]